MEKRRSSVFFLLVAVIPAAQACTPALEGPRLESKTYVLSYRASPEVGKHFSVEIAACAKNGPPPRTLKIDAHMPEHRHGMNYKPTVKPVGPGHWQAEGLLFHMPGKWEFVFVVEGERMTRELVVFSNEEKQKILAHGPWPPAPRRDPSNRVSGKPEAIALGERLFFEPRLRHRFGALRDLPCPLPPLPGCAAARLWPRGRRSQHAEPHERRPVPLVRMGRRAGQPLGAEHPAPARSEGNAGFSFSHRQSPPDAFRRGIREGLRPHSTRGR
jgi:hypothetical protein